MNNGQLPDDREAGTGTVDVEKCLDILRDIVANADNNTWLRRHLRDEFAPDSYLTPHKCEVPAELIESAMKALGWPYPKVPKPRKVPSRPTALQAAALEAMAAGTRITSSRSWGYGRDRYHLLEPYQSLRESTFSGLRDYKWIAVTRGGDSYTTYYEITAAGREALSRYQAKHPSAKATAEVAG